MKIRKDFRPTKKELDKLWATVVKLRAGMKSEYKHLPNTNLHAHHIIGKSTLALRYNLDNGVCVTGGQHFFVAHHTGRSAKFKTWALSHRGVTEDDLLLTSRNRVDLWATQMYLEQKIKELSQ